MFNHLGTLHYRKPLLCRLACLLVTVWTASPGWSQQPIPTPPQQTIPWTPPASTLPATVVSAAQLLFDQGLADPRGCEYREIWIEQDRAWRGEGERTHGWVLPALTAGKSRFAVCWDGLVYPVQRVGDPVSLATDITTHEQANASHAAGGFLGPDVHPGVGTCLLLRLARPELAEKLLNTVHQPIGMRVPEHKDDPYLAVAYDWLDSLFQRAIEAHERSEDSLALQTLRQLAAAWRAVEDTAAHRGFEEPKVGNTQPRRYYLSFLEPVPYLLADYERRAKEPPPPHVLKVGLEKFPDQHARIAALIQDLEDVDAQQYSQPGGVSLGFDPIVQALVKEGDAAVDPLIQTLESDDRLTRSVSFWRSFVPERYIHGVYEAAFVALESIFHLYFTDLAEQSGQFPPDPQWRRAAVARMREYWTRMKALPQAERWFQILADDRQSPDQWLQAARNIVAPANSPLGALEWPEPLTRQERKLMAGESLRAHQNPSVVALMEKRALQMAAQGRTTMDQAKALYDSAAMLQTLSQWDLEASLPALRAGFQRLRAFMQVHPVESVSESLADPVSQITTARAYLHDPGALKEFCEWLHSPGGPAVFRGGTVALEPLWRYREDRDITAAGDWLFNQPHSPWALLPRVQREDQLRGLCVTPAIGIAGLRRLVLQALNDRSAAGSIKCSSVGIDVSYNSGISQSGEEDDEASSGEGLSMGYEFPLPAPAPGSHNRFRRCDLYAWELSGLDGAPQCELYWPEARRNQAVAACRAFLLKFGSRFGASPGQGGDWLDFGGEPYPNAHLVFPRLARPATLRDVCNTAAIFSLEGQGKVRLWPMPARPVKALWITLKEFPYRFEFPFSDDEPRTTLRYQQDGWVWQAEEVLREGRWQRYFGFAGSHHVSRVPAGEIEFTGDTDWSPLAGGIDVKISGPGTLVLPGAVSPPHSIPVGAVTPVDLWFRDRSGLDRTLPSLGTGTSAPGQDAIIMRLQRALLDTADSSALYGLLHGRGKWTEVPPRPGARPIHTPARRLTPTEQFRALVFNLQDRFPLDRPGLYRLQMRFTGAIRGQAYELVLRVGP